MNKLNQTLSFISGISLLVQLSSCSQFKTHKEIKKELPIIYPAPVILTEEKKIEIDVAQVQESSPIKEKEIILPVVNSPKPHIQNFVLKYIPKHYDFWIKYFTQKDKDRFQRHLNNAFQFEKTVKEILNQEGVPEDLFFVGLIESGYNFHIKSKASAVGPWQFISGTGKRYGLRVDGQVDERRSIHEATVAAAKYFKDLYNIFGSWELALCAYNKGEYGIIRSIRKGNTRDYLELIKKRLIPKETVYYIPKVMAAREIFSNPDKYGFKVSKGQTGLFFNVTEISLKKSFKTSSLRKELGIGNDFYKLNPHLKTDYVKVYRSPVTLYIPKDKINLVSQITRMVKETVPAIEKTSEEADSKKMKYYRVKKGDTLFGISQRFKISMNTLKKINNMRSSRIRYGQRLKIKNLRIYVVKKGDNLTKIARKYNVPIQKIVLYNSIKGGEIFPGQEVHIPI